MLIHAEIVGKSKKLYHCEWCHRIIEIGSSYARFYGMAHSGDKPYATRSHLDCVDTSRMTKRERKVKP